MQLINDGAGCCGISHIHDFYGAPTGNNDAARLDELLAKFQNHGAADEAGRIARGYREPRKGLIVVSLTDGQMRGGWAPILKERGFRLVTRFLNSNSGNHVNVLHKTYGNTRGVHRPARPFEW